MISNVDCVIVVACEVRSLLVDLGRRDAASEDTLARAGSVDVLEGVGDRVRIGILLILEWRLRLYIELKKHFKKLLKLCFHSETAKYNNVVLQITYGVMKSKSIDAHGLKIQGRGYLMFFAKISRGGQGFQEELPRGGPPISGFIAFLFTSVLNFA